MIGILLLLFLLVIYIILTYNTPIRGGHDLTKDLIANKRSKSEDNVIKIAEDLLNVKFPTMYPEWLVWHNKNLELDGYNGKDIAIEYSGPLHTIWTPSFESYEHYFNRIINDRVKIKLCARNNVKLIVIDYRIPNDKLSYYIWSRFYDIGAKPTKPQIYIPPITYAPYRNARIELELNLGTLWDEVDSL